MLAATLDPSFDIPTDITFRVYENEDKITVFHAQEKIFGCMRDNSEVLDVEGTTAHTFSTLISDKEQ